ncbi:MAG: hypothetical protein AAF226_08875 [Verrucomicrobiota bacterium]
MLAGAAALGIFGTAALAQDEEVFEFSNEFNWLTGENASILGFIEPELYFIGVGGVFGDGLEASDLATTEHDPQRDIAVQGIEAAFHINANDILTGRVNLGAFQAAEEWEYHVEEAFLHYKLTDFLAVGGGRFLNAFGFQAQRHLHGWDFVNQNLVNSRMLNEAELVTEGGSAIITLPDQRSRITFGAGDVRTHAHGHEEEGHHDEEEEEHHDEEEGEHHDEEEGEHHDEDDDHGHEEHLEAEGANFNNSVFTADWRQYLPFDPSAAVTASIATGENGFNQNTTVYGFGFEKIWGAHDHGAGPEFCENAFMIRSEFIGRRVEIEHDGENSTGEDFGLSTSAHYGLSEVTTLSLRHDWVSEMEELELEERHRISPAITHAFGPNNMIKARVQYDYTDADSLASEHAAWLQFQISWGGGHNHNH